MGWDGERSNKSLQDQISERLNYEATDIRTGEPVKISLLDSSTRGRATYCAVKVQRAGGEFITGIVVLHERHDDMWMFKHVWETMGPCETDCPARILNKLSPVDQIDDSEQLREWAAKWRKACHDKRTGANLPANGQVLKFAEPLSFGSYGTFDTFRTYRTGKKIRFAPIVNGEQREPIYTISHLEKRQFSVVA